MAGRWRALFWVFLVSTAAAFLVGVFADLLAAKVAANVFCVAMIYALGRHVACRERTGTDEKA